MCYKAMRITLIATGLMLMLGIPALSQPPITKVNFAGDFARTPPVSNGVNNTPTVADDVCDQRLAKALASLDVADIQIKARDEQIGNFKEQVKLQEARFQEVLAILKEYATTDAKGRKSIWAKIGKKMVGMLDMLTDPKTIAAIAEIIILSKAVK